MAWGSYAIDATHWLDSVRVDDGGLTGHSSTQARCKGVKRYFYSSSACVYNDDLQLDPENPGLKEGDAWPAKPQDTYGLEKLYAEEMGIVYGRDFGIKFRCARFHNVYGPRGTWKGGREKAPAAFCRKAVRATTDFEFDPRPGELVTRERRARARPRAATTSRTGTAHTANTRHRQRGPQTSDHHSSQWRGVSRHRPPARTPRWDMHA